MFPFSVTAEHLFAENKEKQINAALMALITKDMPPDDLQGKLYLFIKYKFIHIYIYFFI